MFDTVLIANRGEIALRIQRACRLLGLRTVAVHSDVDRDSLHVRLADRSLCIGPGPAAESYLNQAALILAARATGAGAVHPGYGFLSENMEFARKVEAEGLVFIGPTPDTIGMMGDKIAAKRAMQAAGVPCVPGPLGAIGHDFDEVRSVVARLGYPVIIKAGGGGGGRGMRVVRTERQLEEAVMLTREEARRAFGIPDIYVEKFLERPRHIEIQVLADNYGSAVHLGARDCSMQRRHQKVLEEAPAPGIPLTMIKDLSERCVSACRQIGYRGLGTFEFLYEDGVFAFIEMNTRVQVEHPVTEMVTGIDLVRAQICVALGQKLSWRQEDIRLSGHSIECRINAENPQTSLPSTGKITRFDIPGGLRVRVDTAAYAGLNVSPFYDSMIAKVIVSASDRTEAIDRMKVALSEFRVEGVATNIELHKRILDHEPFRVIEHTVHSLETTNVVS